MKTLEGMDSLRETVAYIKERLATDLDGNRIEKLVIGIFFTGVKLESGHGGVAFTPIGEIPEAVCCPKSAARMPEAGRMRGKPAKALLDYALDQNVLKAAIGVATANALSHYLWEKVGPEGYQVVPDVDALEEIDFSLADTVTLVGAFTPFIKLIKKFPCRLYILEKNPQTLKGEELKSYRPPEAAKEVLAQSDIAILTGTTIVNHTIDHLLSLIPEACQVIVAGPTASMVPLAFFKRGVDLLGGVQVTDPDKTLAILAEGGSAYHLFGKHARKITVRPAAEQIR